jgi:hypothetical protein
MSLQKEIESVINCHSAENESDTPDFILAAYIGDCLAAFNRSVNMREAWHGRKPQSHMEEKTHLTTGKGAPCLHQHQKLMDGPYHVCKDCGVEFPQ